jgi:hypothetical protein
MTLLESLIQRYLTTQDPTDLANVLRQLACRVCAESATGATGPADDLLFFSAVNDGAAVFPGGVGARTNVIPPGSGLVAADVTGGGLGSGILLETAALLTGARVAQVGGGGPAGPLVTYEIVVAPPATPFNPTTGVVAASVSLDPETNDNVALVVTNPGPYPAGSAIFAIGVAATGASSPLGVDMSATIQEV